MRRLSLGIAAVASAAAAGAAALASCNDSKLAGCTVAAIDFPAAYVQVAVKDSTYVAGVTISDCPAKIGRAVKFSISNTSLATVRALSDTTAVVRGVAVGETQLVLTPRDYPDNARSFTLNVIGENP